VSLSPPIPEQPELRIGPAWDYGELLPGLYFEVWASLDLVHWVLATNTTEKAALFVVKPQEFYKVRAVLDGMVSDWANK
jgi:hypothetical protein